MSMEVKALSPASSSSASAVQASAQATPQPAAPSRTHLETWQVGIDQAVPEFLAQVSSEIVQKYHLQPKRVLISYAPDAPDAPASAAQSAAASAQVAPVPLSTTDAALQLVNHLEQAGVPYTLSPLKDANTAQQLKEMLYMDAQQVKRPEQHEVAIVFCTGCD